MRSVIAFAALMIALGASVASHNPPTNCDPTQTVACYR